MQNKMRLWLMGNAILQDRRILMSARVIVIVFSRVLSAKDK